jgi:hypothetical protein
MESNCDSHNWYGLQTARLIANSIGSGAHVDITVRVTAEFKDPKHTPVGEVMSVRCFYCFDDQDIEDAWSGTLSKLAA